MLAPTTIDLHSLPMTQLLTGVGQMAFQSIGFTAALILNRLRNERLKTHVADDKNEADEAQKRDEEATRAKLALVNKRLDLLRSRVEPRRGGSGD